MKTEKDNNYSLLVIALTLNIKDAGSEILFEIRQSRKTNLGESYLHPWLSGR